MGFFTVVVEVFIAFIAWIVIFLVLKAVGVPLSWSLGISLVVTLVGLFIGIYKQTK